jgi:hypothetical protein
VILVLAISGAFLLFGRLFTRLTRRLKRVLADTPVPVALTDAGLEAAAALTEDEQAELDWLERQFSDG